MPYKQIAQNKIWAASFTLFGSIVGAGILGIPFVVAKTGWWIGFVYLILLGLIGLISNLMIGEIASRVKGNVHLPGYVDRFLGPKGKKIMIAAFVLNIYGALLAYIIAQGDTLYNLTNLFNPFAWSMIFFALGTLGVFIGIKFLEKYNTQLVIGLLISIGVIVIWGLFGIDFNNYTHVDWTQIGLPYGVLLFAYGGIFVLPTVEQMVDENENSFRKAIIIASILPIIVYTLFTFVVIGVTGMSTTQVATIGLGQALGPVMIIFGNLFAFLAMATSFLSLGVTLKNMWQWDVKLSNWKATAVTVIIPLGLFLLGWDQFITVLSFFGALGTGIILILGVLVFWKIRKQGGDVKVKHPLVYGRLLGWGLIIMAVSGFVATVLMLGLTH